ncbi:hypothetical protein L0F63_007014, partial [Massospora cicadina]
LCPQTCVNMNDHTITTSNSSSVLKLNLLGLSFFKSDDFKELTFRERTIRGTKPSAPGVNCHVMICRGGKDKRIKDMPGPLTLVREAPPEPSGSQIKSDGATSKNRIKAEMANRSPSGGADINKCINSDKRAYNNYGRDLEAPQQSQEETLSWVLKNAQGEEELRGKVDWGSQCRYMAMGIVPGVGFRLYPIKRHCSFDHPSVYRAPTLKAIEAFLNRKLTKATNCHENEVKEDDEDKLKAVDGVDDNKKRPDTEEADDLDYEEDFQDDDEMDETREEVKEVGGSNRKRQICKDHASSESSSEDSVKKAMEADHSIKRLKRMVRSEVSSSSDEEFSRPKITIRKLELPLPTKETADKRELSQKSKKVSNVFPTPVDPGTMTCEEVAAVIKSNPGINMRGFIQKVKLAHLKWDHEKRAKFMALLGSVAYTPKDSDILYLREPYV